MTPEQATQEARSGTLRPVYLVLGEERYLQSIVLTELRKATVGTSALGLNEDHFEAGESDVDAPLAAARTLPMMASRRLVVVRSVERWEPKSEAKSDGDGAAETGKGRARTPPLDRLVEYAASPSPTTTLVLVSGKLDARRRLVLSAKKEGFLVECDAPPRSGLTAWLGRRAKERGKTLAPGIGELLAEIAGPELSRLDDAIERLSLYVGEASEIDDDAVASCIVGVKASSVWELTAAVGRRDLGAALATLASVYDPKDRGLPLVGTLAWSTRQLIKFQAATLRGQSPADAAKYAGAPPFKAGDLAAQTRALAPRELRRWLLTIAGVDLALKGGSRRSALSVLESALITLSGRGTGTRAPAGDTSGRGGPPRDAGSRRAGP